MSTKHMWGFGGVRLTCPDLSLTCDLPHALGSMAYEPEQFSIYTLDGERVTTNYGYRINIAFEAVNSCATDYTSFVTLIAILNASFSQARDIYIYPYFTSTENNLSYKVHCTSPVAFESIAPVKVGQRIKLSFVSVERESTLPALTSDPSDWDWVDHDGNTMVDHDGNTLIFST